MQVATQQPQAGQRYLHFKGGDYTVLASTDEWVVYLPTVQMPYKMPFPGFLARHTEDGSIWAVWQYNDGKTEVTRATFEIAVTHELPWIRPLASFMAVLGDGDEAYPRFQLMGEP